MVSVVRDKNSGSWLARWRDPSGRQRKKSFARKSDAQRGVDQMQAARHRGQYIDPRAATVRVEEIAEAWETGLIHLKESTAFRYRGILRLHVLPRFGSWQLNDIRRSDIQAWVSDLVSGGLAPGTVRQNHRVLSLLIDSAVADGRLAANPAHGVKLPRIRRGEPRFLTAGEVTSSSQPRASTVCQSRSSPCAVSGSVSWPLCACATWISLVAGSPSQAR